MYILTPLTDGIQLRHIRFLLCIQVNYIFLKLIKNNYFKTSQNIGSPYMHFTINSKKASSFLSSVTLLKCLWT